MQTNHWVRNLVQVVSRVNQSKHRCRHKISPRSRIGVESLETRQVMTASIPVLADIDTNVQDVLIAARPVVAPLAVHQGETLQRVGVLAAPGPTHRSTLPSASAMTAELGSAKTVKASPVYVYSAVTIKNTTNITVNYSYNWNGNRPSKFSLSPGTQRVHYISSLNRTGTIKFDKSFASGYQEQAYSLPAQNITRPGGFYLVEPTPGVSEGRRYYFQRVSNGIQLYK